jgi:hypothetical protein
MHTEPAVCVLSLKFEVDVCRTQLKNVPFDLVCAIVVEQQQLGSDGCSFTKRTILITIFDCGLISKRRSAIESESNPI